MKKYNLDRGKKKQKNIANSFETWEQITLEGSSAVGVADKHNR